jgi:hypothetical protein
MEIKNKYVDSFSLDDVEKHETSVLLSNCFIETIDLVGSFELGFELIIENCFIDNLLIHSCWFSKGLSLKANHIKNIVDYQMGGHNTLPIFIKSNIFEQFFNFFDCQFSGYIEVSDNIFIEGTNLLGNMEEGFHNTFETAPVVKNNLGKIDCNGEGLI